MTNIVTVRFDQSTWEENCHFRSENNNLGCVYGSHREMTKKIPLNSLVFIVEMNNSTNKIEGVGLVRKITRHDKKLKIYGVGSYNRYIYKGNYRLDRITIEETHPRIIQIFDQILFKGKSHLKRGIGFTSITEKLYNKNKVLEVYNYTEQQIKEELTALFKCHFHKNNSENFSENIDNNIEKN